MTLSLGVNLTTKIMLKLQANAIIFLYIFLNICFITAVYTLFALAEYCTIVSNVVFHWLCTHIYKGSTIAILYPDDYVPKMS